MQRHRLIAVAVAAVLFVAWPGLARGNETPVTRDVAPKPPPPPPRVKVQGFGGLVVQDDAPGAQAPVTHSGISRVSTSPSWSFWIYNYVDGVFCRQRVTTRSEARAAGLQSYATQADLPVCARPPNGQPQRGPDDAARDFWDLRVLPDPVLEVVPGYALAGKPVYLQIHGDPVRSFDVDNPLGDDVAISASSTYEIDWGDHSPTRVTTSQGGPWPDGDVTHTYTVVNPATTITVTQRWTATWRAGAGGGQLDGLQTTATLTLPVTQLQAVRNT